MNAVVPTVRLHLAKRDLTFLVPVVITLVVAAVSVLISVLFWRSGSTPGSDSWIAGSQSNMGIAWSLPGFLVYLGVQSVATTFPFALALGSTRRSFVAGTLTWWVGVSAYVTVLLALLTVLEITTGHWFAHLYIFDVTALGGGDFALLVPIAFLGTLTSLAIGGLFGAGFVRFGSRGPIAIAVVLAVAILLALILGVPAAAQIAAAFEPWWLAVLAVGIIAVSAVGTWLMLRPASVR
jgi:hypothetical protein